MLYYQINASACIYIDYKHGEFCSFIDKCCFRGVQPTIYQNKVLTFIENYKLDDDNQLTYTATSYVGKYMHKLFVDDGETLQQQNEALQQLYMLAQPSGCTFQTQQGVTVYKENDSYYVMVEGEPTKLLSFDPVFFWFDGDWYCSNTLGDYNQQQAHKINITMSYRPEIQHLNSIL